MSDAARVAWVLGVAALVAAPARAEPQRRTFALHLAPGDRIERTLVRELTTRIGEKASSGTKTIETVDAWVTVDATSPTERMTVEHPRAVARTALGGAAAGAPVATAFHGATVRYDFVEGAWKGTSVAGPTPPALGNWLADGVDPLRRPLVPTKALAVGEVAEFTGTQMRSTLRHVLPIPVVSVESVALRLEGVAGKDADAFASLRGVVRFRTKLSIAPYGELDAALELSISEEIGLTDGLLRSLSISGKTIVLATAGGATERVDVKLDVKETAAKRPASWTPARHAEAWIPTATIVPVFDARAWTVAHHRLVEGANIQSLTEWRLPGEKLVDGTEDGWTEMVAAHRLAIAGVTPSPHAVYEAKRREVERAAPGAAWTIVRESEIELVYEWTLKGDKRFKDQHELGRIVRAGDVLLQVRYVKKVARLPDDERTAWLARLAAANVVGSR